MIKIHNLKKKASRGYILAEHAVGLMMYSFILASALFLVSIGKNIFEYYSTGLRVKRVQIAAEQYVTKNWSTLIASAASEPILITPFNLVDDDKWDIAQTNGTSPNLTIDTQSGHTVHILFQRLSDSTARMLTVTNGDTPTESQAGYAAASAGDNGGVISNTSSECAPLTNPCGLGKERIWAVALSNFSGTTTDPFIPGSNQIASISYFGEGEVIKPYLYRYDCGDPECQTMYSDINMNGNSITSVDDIYLNSRGVWLSQAVQTFYVVSHNQVITKPSCPTNAPNARIYISQQIWSDSGNSLPVASAQFRAFDNGSEWQVSIDVLTQDGWTNPPADSGKALAIITCDA